MSRSSSAAPPSSPSSPPSPPPASSPPPAPPRPSPSRATPPRRRPACASSGSRTPHPRAARFRLARLLPRAHRLLSPRQPTTPSRRPRRPAGGGGGRPIARSLQVGRYAGPAGSGPIRPGSGHDPRWRRPPAASPTGPWDTADPRLVVGDDEFVARVGHQGVAGLAVDRGGQRRGPDERPLDVEQHDRRRPRSLRRRSDRRGATRAASAVANAGRRHRLARLPGAGVDDVHPPALPAPASSRPVRREGDRPDAVVDPERGPGGARRACRRPGPRISSLLALATASDRPSRSSSIASGHGRERTRSTTVQVAVSTTAISPDSCAGRRRRGGRAGSRPSRSAAASRRASNRAAHDPGGVRASRRGPSSPFARQRIRATTSRVRASSTVVARPEVTATGCRSGLTAAEAPTTRVCRGVPHGDLVDDLAAARVEERRRHVERARADVRDPPAAVAGSGRVGATTSRPGSTTAGGVRQPAARDARVRGAEAAVGPDVPDDRPCCRGTSSSRRSPDGVDLGVDDVAAVPAQRLALSTSDRLSGSTSQSTTSPPCRTVPPRSRPAPGRHPRPDAGHGRGPARRAPVRSTRVTRRRPTAGRRRRTARRNSRHRDVARRGSGHGGRRPRRQRPRRWPAP